VWILHISGQLFDNSLPARASTSLVERPRRDIMEDTTLRQAAHILRIVEEKATPKAHLQDIIGTGLFSDLLDANVGEVDRDVFRRVLGLAPLSLRYDPDKFFRTRPGLWVSDSFRNLVVAKTSPSVKGRAVVNKSIMLESHMLDTGIEEMLGEGHIFTEDQLCDFLAKMIEEQKGGEEGRLLNNGHANIFYLASCVVGVGWSRGRREWDVGAWYRDDGRWDAGGRIFSPATAA
jgi:hypothetical protein